MSQAKALTPVVSVSTTYQSTVVSAVEQSSKALQPFCSMAGDQTVTPKIAV